MLSNKNRILAWLIDGYSVEIILRLLLAKNSPELYMIISILLFILTIIYHLRLYERFLIMTPGEMCIGAKLSETGKIYLNPFNSSRAFLWIMMVINLSNMRNPIFIDGIVGEIILLILFLGTLFGYAYLNQGIKKYIYLLFVYPLLNIVSMLISKEEMVIVLLSLVINVLTMYSAALYYKKLENIESEKI